MAKDVEYKVTGRGPFPSDMLRYDGAIPATTADEALIEANQRNYKETYTVALVGRHCTAGRWKSFGWRVER